MHNNTFFKPCKFSTYPFLLVSLLAFISCSNGQKVQNMPQTGPGFGDYWFQGLAELSSYELDQSRYGENRKGKAVMVFVTEDFSKRQHVKLDNPIANPGDKVTVLKLNFMRNFQTGIYPYSIMASSFMPISGAPAGLAEKTSVSVQEWCGHIFDQLYKDGRKYKRYLSSYFESEGEQTSKLEQVPLELSLWNSLRIDPNTLPLGTFQIIPDQVYSRLMHKELKVVQVIGSLKDVEWNAMKLKSYILNYPGEKRQLRIFFQSEFPYIIEGWEEQYIDIKGNPATTSGKRIKTIQLDYWNKNANKFNIMNDEFFNSAIEE